MLRELLRELVGLLFEGYLWLIATAIIYAIIQYIMMFFKYLSGVPLTNKDWGVGKLEDESWN